MYLCKVNTVTGLIDVAADQDGFYAIPEFRRLLNSKQYGLEKLTCVALVVDYESPIRMYHEKEKPFKAMDNVLNNRKLINWKSDEIQEALIAYKALQHDLDLEEKKMLDNMRFDKQMEADQAPTLEEKMKKIQELGRIKALIAAFNSQTSNKDLYENSPVRNGYTLSRLEQKLENKKSFYHVRPEKREKQSGSES